MTTDAAETVIEALPNRPWPTLGSRGWERRLGGQSQSHQTVTLPVAFKVRSAVSYKTGGPKAALALRGKESA